ncbi:PLC-like phosphodiesterase, partial [Coemansia spiralis]
CNGYKELCDRQFNLVAYPTTHNSYAFGDNIAANQNKNITDQLDDGIRGFMLDLHNPSSTSLSLRASSEPYLCHTTCLLLNDGPLSQTLQYFTTFLEANENEVITIFFENDDKFSATTIAQSFKDVGLDKYAFVPSGSSSNGNYTWPTLAEMIADNKRLVVMVDGESNTAAVPWILYDRDYTVQTPYTVGVGSTFDCTPMTQARPLVVMNHFVYTNYTVLNSVVEKPSPDTASTVNTRQSIVGQANLCGSAARFPNFVTVDFYDVGDLFKAVADINKVQYSSSSTTLDTFSGGVPSSSYTSTASQSTLSL